MAVSQVLTRGQNTELTADSVVVTIGVDAPADLSALLVNSAGVLRTDEDLIFFNQPDGPGGALPAGRRGLAD